MQQLSEGALVFHHEQGGRSRLNRTGLYRLNRCFLHRLIDAREIDAESRSFPQFGIGEHKAATLLHDAIHSCESESRTFASYLGGEERFK